MAGLVALERDELADAAAELGWVAEHGGTVEDHFARVEAYVRLGDVVRARTASEALHAAYPDYALGAVLVSELGDG